MSRPAPFTLEGKRVFVAGHRGMVGAALVRRLAREDCTVLTVPRADLDLRNRDAVAGWMHAQRPDAVMVAAARVGGIHANSTYPADFLYDNLAIATATIDAAHRTGVAKLLYLGSSCIYPRLADQPIREDALLTGPLEPTNEWYAVAKIAGIKLCDSYRLQHGADFISCMPPNLYGPNDNFHPMNSHVLAALMRRIHEAKVQGLDTVTVWGTGRPRREFMHVDDLADACVFLLRHYSEAGVINAGTGEEISIGDLARTIAAAVGWTGRLVFDPSKPDGMPRKILDAGRLAALGWRHRIGLREGIEDSYRWFLAQGPDGGAVRT